MVAQQLCSDGRQDVLPPDLGAKEVPDDVSQPLGLVGELPKDVCVAHGIVLRSDVSDHIDTLKRLLALHPPVMHVNDASQKA